ncbi:MAG TPA: TolC family protein [Chryseolinea sp.]|nr:TolC family protein [Chryseolinea sp.]
MNKSFPVFFVAVLCLVATVSGQTRYTLEDVLQMGREQSPFSRQAETRKENRYWQYRSFRSNYNPQLRLSGNLPDYNQDYVQNRLDDGTIAFQQREQTTGAVNLGLLQPIFFTGGFLSVNSNLNRYNDFLYNIESWNSTVLNVRLDQPLLAFNQLRWDKKTEPLRYEESRRDYVEEMEFISREVTDKFFSVLDAQINLEIAQFNLANNDTIYKIEAGRYNIGTTPKDKLLQAELQLLQSQQDVTSAKISLQNNKLDLRSFLGLRDAEEFSLILPEQIPQMTIELNEALRRARENRADFIAFERRKIEAEREVAAARGQRFQANLSASFGLNNQAPTLDGSYDDPLRQQRVNVSFNFPVLDWGRNKARMKTAFANQKLNNYVIEQDEVNFEQEIITQVTQFDVLLSQIRITKKSDEVAQERYMVSQNRYLIGKIDITNLNIALTEKDKARRGYLDALRSFWTSYFDLRRLTLYDFANGQLLYKPD